MITASAAPPTQVGTPTTLLLRVDFVEVDTSGFPGTVTYTFPTDATVALNWDLFPGNAVWSVGCESGACTAPNGENLTLHDDTVLDARTFAVCNTIEVGPNYQVMGPSGDLTLQAGSVVFKDGTSVGLDGSLTVEAD